MEEDSAAASTSESDDSMFTVPIWVSVERSFPPPMVMVMTAPLSQPCTTACSYVHNGFVAAREQDLPLGGMVVRLRLELVARLGSTTPLQGARLSFVDHANTFSKTLRFHWFLQWFLVMQRPPPLWDGGMVARLGSSSYFGIA